MGREKRSFWRKAVPMYLVVWLVVDGVIVGGVGGYWWLRQRVRAYEARIYELEHPEEMVQKVKGEVLPAGGYETSLLWGDLGKRLVEAGAIDLAKYEEMFKSPVDGGEELEVLKGNSDKKIAINENNSRFVVNTLWALGLVNKSKVLDEGPMRTGETPTGNFASTGGWTLGKKEAMELYSSQVLIPLNDEQQERVRQIAENVYRPCCGNHTAFPDCNHGMAALGYVEMAVAAGLSDGQIYKDLLAFNSFWFPETYVEMAMYFEKERGISWDKVDAKLALSSDYSSAQGAAKVRRAVQENVPGLSSQGGGCGA